MIIGEVILLYNIKNVFPIVITLCVFCFISFRLGTLLRLWGGTSVRLKASKQNKKRALIHPLLPQYYFHTIYLPKQLTFSSQNGFLSKQSVHNYLFYFQIKFTSSSDAMTNWARLHTKMAELLWSTQGKITLGRPIRTT